MICRSFLRLGLFLAATLSANVIKILAAEISDVPAILEMITELAVFEKLGDQMKATEEDLEKTLFGPARAAEVYLLWEDYKKVGMALFFQSYSTFLGKPGIYLEDLYIRPASRGRGHGRSLLAFIARLAVERGCGRFEWSVLNWNEPAIQLYKSLGAEPLQEWTIYRISGAPLQNLAHSVI